MTTEHCSKASFSKSLLPCLLFSASCLLIPASSLAVGFAGTLTGVTITDSQGSNAPPVATFTYTIDGNSVTFDATASSDSDGTLTEFKWDFGDGNNSSGATTTHQYTDTTPMAVTLTLIDNNKAIAITQQSIQFQPAITISVNFQPGAAPPQEGYLMDSGLSYSAPRGYGWISGPSSQGTRDRDNANSPNQAYDTMIHVAPTSIWEMDLPAGNYSVTICNGDPSFAQGTQYVKAEGITIIDNVIISGATPWVERTATVTVSDGRLSISFAGSSNPARLSWLTVTSTN